MAKDITRGIITPGAQEIAKNAVPITEEVSTPETSQSLAVQFIKIAPGAQCSHHIGAHSPVQGQSLESVCLPTASLHV